MGIVGPEEPEPDQFSQVSILTTCGAYKHCKQIRFWQLAHIEPKIHEGNKLKNKTLGGYGFPMSRPSGRTTQKRRRPKADHKERRRPIAVPPSVQQSGKHICAICIDLDQTPGSDKLRSSHNKNK